MTTTLEQELLQAADDATASALAYATFLGKVSNGVAKQAVFEARASRLRQRAAWVRELERQAAADVQAFAMRGAIRALTGPIPSETAPAAPKEGTGGATAGEAKPRECQVQGCGRHVGDCPHGARP
jgi:hypothetical protein